MTAGFRTLRRFWRSFHWASQTSMRPEYMRAAYCTPRQVVLVTARCNRVMNVWPIDWHIPLSIQPELYGIALNRESYGTEMIRSTGVFVVNFVPAAWEDVILFCGRTSGREVDKISATRLRIEQSDKVDAPRLKDALACLECTVEKVIEVGDHEFFVARIQNAVSRLEAPRLHHITRNLSDSAESFEAL